MGNVVQYCNITVTTLIMVFHCFLEVFLRDLKKGK